MSKEKNLTFYNERCERAGAKISEKFKLIDPGISTFTFCMSDKPRYLYDNTIDRLHEFEKLGLEPEEIKQMMEDLDAVTANNVNYKTQSVVAKKHMEHLINTLFDNMDVVAELTEENERLKSTLREKTEEYRAKIMAMSRDMDELEEEIKEREKVEEELHKELGNLKESLKILAR